MKTQVVSRNNQIRSILFVTLLMTITFVVILKDYSLTEIVHVIESVHPFYLIAGILMMLIYFGCQAMNFYIILSKLQHPVSYGYCIEYAYVGNYFGAITPGASGGQPAQLYYMSKDKIHVDLSAITVFLMVFISQIVILVFGGVMAILRYPLIARYESWMKYLTIAGSVAMLVLTIILMSLMFMRKIIPFLFKAVLQVGIKVHLIKKPEEVKGKFAAIFLSYHEKSKMLLKHPDLFVKVFLITVVQWASYYMVSYLVYLGFGHRQNDALDLMSGQSLISIAVAAVPLPGSVGIAEKAYLNVYGQFYTAQELPSAMILSRIINFYMPLFISFIVYMIVHFRAIKMKKSS